MKWFFPLLLLILLPPNSKADVPSTLAERCVQHYAVHYRVPPELISALIDVESRWNPRALSNNGAMGLMQLMPDTARRYGAFQPFDVDQNIAAGTRYVTTLMWEFRGTCDSLPQPTTPGITGFCGNNSTTTTPTSSPMSMLYGAAT